MELLTLHSNKVAEQKFNSVKHASYFGLLRASKYEYINSKDYETKNISFTLHTDS